IIAVASYRLARGTNKRDPLLWGVFATLFLATVLTGAELAALFILAGVVQLLVRAWPGRSRAAVIIAAALAGCALIWALERFLLPVYFSTILPAPWFRRHRDNLQLRAFAAGSTAAASDAIAWAVLVLGRRAVIDIPTALVALLGLVLLWRFRVQEPYLVAGAG